MRIARPFALPLLALLAALCPAGAQTPTPPAPAPPAPTPITTDSADSSAPPVPTIEVNTRLVAVSAVVHDKAGKPVSGLTRDDFILKQDGKPQPITYLSQGSDLPLTLALMVDTSGSQRAYIQDEIAAGHSFFPAMLTRPDDRAVLVQFDDRVLQLAALTSNETTLEHALAYLTQSHVDIGTAGRGGTLLFDAIAAVSRLELGTQMGRRAMVILTDGGDNGSHFKQKQAIEAAQRADIVLYTIYYSRGGGDEGVLRNLSKATGGREFAVGSDLPLSQIYAQIAEDMRLEYELGYAPPDTRPDKYHKIDLAPKDKDLVVQAREGYFTPK